MLKWVQPNQLCFIALGPVLESQRQFMQKGPLYFQEKLVQFILACQDEETGGFADRPGDIVSMAGFFLASVFFFL